MKKILALIVLLTSLLCGNTSYAQRARMPQPLKPGDKIAIISPAGSHAYSIAERGRDELQKWGYVVEMGKSVGKNWHGYSGTPEQRRDDLLWALQDTAIKAIMCTRGGYGCSQVLSLVSPKVFRDNPKWIIGYSDVTALLSAQVRAGVMSIHGNMCDPIARDDSTCHALRYLLAGKMPLYNIGGDPHNKPGTARGMLVGGNLSVFTDIAASPYDFLDRDFIKGKDIILFIEDTNEDFQHIDRMLYQLKLRGVFKQIKGLIVGIFNGYSPGNGYKDMYDLIAEIVNDADIPICYGFPAGHRGRTNYPLIEGCPVTLNVAMDSATLQFNVPIRISRPD